MKLTTEQSFEAIHCRASGAALTPSAPWKQDEPVKFMYMPAGRHTVCAGFRKGSINLTVDVDPQRDANVCQASLDAIIDRSPKQKAFGCFEHHEEDASVWAKSFIPGDDGIYLEATPSKAGADSVNGRNHRSWSPSFGTDAEYAKAKCRACEKLADACKCGCDSDLYFPDGVRGSETNPAHITGVAKAIGTLTNKPAFHDIAPVRAKDFDNKTECEFDYGKDASEQASVGQNPASWVEDENKWEESKKAASEHKGTKNYYAYVVSIYKKMGGGIKSKIKTTEQRNQMQTINLQDESQVNTATNEIINATLSMSDDTIRAGDYPGHPFRGNQYADGEGEGEHHRASHRAHTASISAHSAHDHKVAQREHEHAAKLHEDEGNESVAAYHEAAAAYHAKAAKKKLPDKFTKTKASEHITTDDILASYVKAPLNPEEPETIFASYSGKTGQPAA